MKKRRKRLFFAAFLTAAFAMWTAAVLFADVQPIGPLGSQVGLARLNAAVFAFTGVHMALYDLTDALSIVPLSAAAGFGALGCFQWLRRKKLSLADRDILILGAFYCAVAAAFVLFQLWEVNFRPVLIEGRLEASYPSSTTLLVLSVMPTAAMQLRRRIKNRALCRWCTAFCAVFSGFMVLCRLLSGVHWASDIIGGALLSAALVMLYAALAE